MRNATGAIARGGCRAVLEPAAATDEPITQRGGRVPAATQELGLESAARTWPGRIAHTHLGKTVLGELDGRTTPRLEAVAALFAAAELPVDITSNIQGHVWQKFILNAALDPLAAITRLRLGDIAESAAATALVHRILDEVLAVVAAEGIELPDPDPRASILGHVVGRLNKPSMLQHVEQGRHTEIDALNGALLGHAARHGIACPVNTTIVQLVQANDVVGIIADLVTGVKPTLGVVRQNAADGGGRQRLDSSRRAKRTPEVVDPKLESGPSCDKQCPWVRSQKLGFVIPGGGFVRRFAGFVRRFLGFLRGFFGPNESIYAP